MKQKMGRVLAACGMAAMALTLQWATPTHASPTLPAGVASLAPMVDDVTPGVVGISVSQSRTAENPLMRDPFMREWLEELQRKRGGGSGNGNGSGQPEVRPAGSGVVVDARQGLVLTNHHVIQGAARVVVVLKDRREFEAHVVGSDAGTDIAVLRIKGEKLTEVKLGDSEALRVGDFAVAIGNPFGIGQTVTMGIVSALGRGITSEGFEDYIQTDAAINPGNSGGALVNLKGELIGINTAIYSRSGPGGGAVGNIGIGFAVPSAMAREVMTQIVRFGEVRRGRVGIQVGEVTNAIASQQGLAAIAGAVATEVGRGSPAERAGLRAGDVLLSINGRPVRTGADARNRFALVPVGESAEVVIVRNRTQSTLRVTVEAVTGTQTASAGSSSAGAGQGAPQGSAGTGSASLEGLQLSADQQGLKVTRVAAKSSSYEVGFREGDIVLAVERQAVRTPQEFSAMLQRPGRKIITVLRGDNKVRLTLG